MEILYSIIIPHKDIPCLLQRCLDSIPPRDDVQIIVADDDSSLDVEGQLEKLLKENMPNGKETPKQSLEQIRIDWNKYM